jgi:hypothetical protein
VNYDRNTIIVQEEINFIILEVVIIIRLKQKWTILSLVNMGKMGQKVIILQRETKNENFEHLIIVTDVEVDTYDIDEMIRE